MRTQAAKVALALLVYAFSTAVHAGGAENSSLLQCGVNLGGKTLTYEAAAAAQDKRDNRMNHVAGTAVAQQLQFTTTMANDAMSGTTKTSDTRLPPTFTLAIFGCSWR